MNLIQYSFYFNKMQDANNLMNSDLAVFVANCIEKTVAIKKETSASNEEIILSDLKNIAFKVDDIADNLVHYLTKYKGLIVTANPQKTMLARWFSLLLVSIYLYCLAEYIAECVNPKKELWNMKYATLFLARDIFESIADKSKIDKGQQEGIFSTIESRYGFNGPIKIKPIPDSPSDAFVYAIMLYDDGIRFPRQLK